ncbi:MAG: beta-galactosidase [Actinomycetota bacterium]|nr:beta-galactosidase [Actinomycetota bacterium]
MPPSSFVSGEFHFWRHPQVFWEQILDTIKDLGFPAVATFLCWDFHEVEEGIFDFTGRTAPERDIGTFLQMCQERDLEVFVRPGPIIDSEWPSRGPTPDVATLERTDPRFRKRAEEWTRRVSRLLAPYQAPDGPVVWVQIDNEIFYPHFTEASATEADAAFHIPFDAEQVKRDLGRWKSDQSTDGELAGRVAGFPEDPAPGFADLDRADQRLAFDFITWVVEDYIRWVRDIMRAEGISVPITTNIKQSCVYLDPGRLGRSVDFIGFNFYLEHFDQDDHFHVGFWWSELARNLLRYPWAPEFWCGRWVEEDADPRVFKHDHYRYVMLTTMALGFRGFNFFMLVDRDDWHYSPVTGLGKTRRSAEAVRELLPLMHDAERDERLAEVGLIWSQAHHDAFVADKFDDWKDPSGIWWEQEDPKELAAWWNTFSAFVSDDHDCRLICDEKALVDAPVVIYAGPDWAEGWLIDGIARRLRDGSPTVLTGDAPLHNVLGTRHKHADEFEAGFREQVRAEDVVEHLGTLGFGSSVRAQRPLLTTAFRRANGSVWLFAINPSRHEVESNLEMSDALRAGNGWRRLTGEGKFDLGASSICLPAKSVLLLESLD